MGPYAYVQGDPTAISSYIPLQGDYLNSLPQSAVPQRIQMAGQYDPSLTVAGVTSRAATTKNATSGQDMQQVLTSQPNIGAANQQSPAYRPGQIVPPSAAKSQGTMPDGITFRVAAPTSAAVALTSAQLQNALNLSPAVQLGGPNLPRLQTAPSDWIPPNQQQPADAGAGIIGPAGGNPITRGILGNGPALSFGGLLGDQYGPGGNSSPPSGAPVGLVGGGMFVAPANQWAPLSTNSGQGAGSNGGGNDGDGGLFVNDSAFQNNFSAPDGGNPAQGLTPYQRAAMDQRTAMSLANGLGMTNQPTNLSNGIQQALDNLHAIKDAPPPAKAGATQPPQTANKTYWSDAVGNFLPPAPDLSDVTSLGNNLELHLPPTRVVTAPTISNLADANRIVANRAGGYIGPTTQCASLTQALVPGIGQVSTWRRGELVRGNMNIPVGTAIATFNYYGTAGTNGYGPPSSQSGLPGMSHTGIYLGQNDAGIQILNQYRRSHGARVETIPWDRWGGSPSEAGNRYFTILPQERPGS